MDLDVLFAGRPVNDFERAREWYERFFGRQPDLVARSTKCRGKWPTRHGIDQGSDELTSSEAICWKQRS